MGGAGAPRPAAVVRLAWDAAGRKVQALDEASRAALRRSPLAHDALEEILAPRPGPRPLALPTGRPRLGVVPLWDDDQAADGL